MASPSEWQERVDMTMTIGKHFFPVRETSVRGNICPSSPFPPPPPSPPFPDLGTRHLRLFSGERERRRGTNDILLGSTNCLRVYSRKQHTALHAHAHVRLFPS